MGPTAQRQLTLASDAVIAGIGVHSGCPARARVTPAPPGHGIVFRRDGGRPVRAVRANVTNTALCTVLGEGRDAVSTVEHLMAALAGLGIDNALVEVDGPEIPILDGSALPIVAAIDAVGAVAQPAARRRIRVLRTVEVERGGAHARLDPAPLGFHLDVRVEFPGPIGSQGVALTLTPRAFRNDLAHARTFGNLGDVHALWASGMALGASLDNTVVVAGGGIANPEGLRDPLEFARHKALDAVGDLALAGYPIVGAFRSTRGGHGLNAALVDALLSDPANYAVQSDAPPVGAAVGPSADRVTRTAASGGQER